MVARGRRQDHNGPHPQLHAHVPSTNQDLRPLVLSSASRHGAGNVDWVLAQRLAGDRG
jgi:hypothetical protein